MEDQALAALRRLAANIIRVARGAGDPLGLLEQVRAITAVIESGARPTQGQIIEALKVGIYHSPKNSPSDNEWLIDDGDERIIDGALTVAAARLAGGSFGGAHAAKGRELIWLGIQQRQKGVEGNLRGGK